MFFTIPAPKRLYPSSPPLVSGRTITCFFFFYLFLFAFLIYCDKKISLSLCQDLTVYYLYRAWLKLARHGLFPFRLGFSSSTTGKAFWALQVLYFFAKRERQTTLGLVFCSFLPSYRHFFPFYLPLRTQTLLLSYPFPPSVEDQATVFPSSLLLMKKRNRPTKRAVGRKAEEMSVARLGGWAEEE